MTRSRPALPSATTEPAILTVAAARKIRQFAEYRRSALNSTVSDRAAAFRDELDRSPHTWEIVSRSTLHSAATPAMSAALSYQFRFTAAPRGFSLATRKWACPRVEKYALG